MWFLIKGTFWFSLVLVLLPFLDPASTSTLERGPKMDVGETFSAATEAFGYISAICIQKPDVCEKGGETFVALGHRAREGARIAYQFLDQQFASPDDAVMTGTIAAVADPNDALAVDAEGDAVPLFKNTPVPEPRIEPKTARAK